MAGRPGFFGALRGGADRDPDFGANRAGGADCDPDFGADRAGGANRNPDFEAGSADGADRDQLAGAVPVIRLGDPSTQENGFTTRPDFDPIWGTLGSPAETMDQWTPKSADPELEGPAVDVEMFGDGFQITGRLHIGQFDRLSDWLNMQTGFIMVQDACLTRLGRANAPDPDDQQGLLWVRMNQVVLVAERALLQQARPGAPVISKQRRMVTIVTPGYTVRGNLHVHAHGSMKQYLESADPRFIPLTDVNLRWLSDPTLINRFPFGLVNREQLVSVLDDPMSTAGEDPRPIQSVENQESEAAAPFYRRSGAA